MKTKKEKITKIKDIRPIIINEEPKAIDENGYPIPKKVRCFQSHCKKEFWLKFSVPQRNYVRKNHWGYWTEQETDWEKYICNFCLKNFYLNQRKEFLTTVKNLKKRNNLRSLISDKFI